MWNKKLSNQKGFSLIELLVVIAIIGILAAIIAPNAFRAIENSRVAAALGDYKVIKSAALQHYADTARFPADGRDGRDPNLMVDVGNDNEPNEAPHDTPGWNGPYLTYWKAKHPWGEYYEYVNTKTWNTGVAMPEEEVKAARRAFFGDPNAPGHVVSLKLHNLGDEVYQRIKEELGAGAVGRDGNNVYLLIHKVTP